MSEEKIELTEEDEKKFKDFPLPAVGTKFMINGKEYVVCYINEGRRRFSAVPHQGQY